MTLYQSAEEGFGQDICSLLPTGGIPPLQGEDTGELSPATARTMRLPTWHHLKSPGLFSLVGYLVGPLEDIDLYAR